MVMYWVRDAIAAGEDFAVAIRRKRIVLQENDNWEVNVRPPPLLNASSRSSSHLEGIRDAVISK